MPSPFPGMDPYLEAHWRDVHTALIIYTRDALQGRLPDSLRARVEERVLLETPEGVSNYGVYPDVRVVEYPSKRRGKSALATIAVAEPFIIPIDMETVTEQYLQIIDTASGNRIVTIIEFLSPSNKEPGANRNQYLQKRKQIYDSDASMVEIDLVRAGEHILEAPRDAALPGANAPYMVCVRRAWVRNKLEVYSIGLRHRLPAIRIPLRESDDDVPLELQALIDQCYENGAYEGTINYLDNPLPALTRSDAHWADEMLAKKGFRPKKRPAGGKKKSR
jgi:Protein of unknown function (DUF4058)